MALMVSFPSIIHNTHKNTTEAMKYNVPRHHPPAPTPIAASLILTANNIQKKPDEISQYEGVSFYWAPRL
jgi:hypothetical protein